MIISLQPTRFRTVGMKEHENGHTETDQRLYLTHCAVYKNGHKQMTREGYMDSQAYYE